MESIRRRFIGDRAFYRRMLACAVPVMIQIGITNFINLLDNVMVGQLGTEAMTGVSIANQLITIFNLAINALGAFVHSCRLQYVEFFGKFYTGGGRPFAPFERKTKYIKILKEGNDND